MSFQTFPVDVAGPSYQSRTRPVSSQATINFYRESDPNNKSPDLLHSWPGEKLISQVTGKDRGQHIMAQVVYRVAGDTLYEIRGTDSIPRGTIAGLGRCIFANDGENMFIVNNGNVQQYSSVTEQVTPVTDIDIVGSIAVDFLNNQFIYTKPNLFVISDVGNGASASGLNAAQAESQPDDLVRAYVFDQVVYMLGELSTELWYNSGTGSPPFERIETQMSSVGIGATHSVTHNDNFMYWLGDDRQVYQAAGGTVQRVSTKAIAHAIEGYTTVSDAVGMTLTMEGQNFYILNFPTENQTWALNESLELEGWFQLSADTERGKWNITSLSYLNGCHFVADELNGKLYELDLDTFTNDGEVIQRTRVMSSLHGGMIGHPGKNVQMSRFELIMDVGVGLITGQGEDPKIMINFSIDGGKSFTKGDYVEIGRLGDTKVRVEWWALETFYDLIIELVTSDPVHYTIISGAIDVRLAGR